MEKANTFFFVFAVSALNLNFFEAQAQKTFQLGVSVGANISSVKYNTEPYHNGTLTTGYRAGLAAGIIGKLNLGQHWAIQPSLRYLRSGFSTDETVSDSNGGSSYSYYQNKYALNRIELPINALYYFNKNAQGFYILGGASIGSLLSGKRSYNSMFTDNGSVSTYAGSDDIKVSDVYPFTGAMQYSMRRWDIGIQAGAGYQIGRIGIQADYRLGIINTATNAQGNLPSPTIYSKMAEVQMHYYFLP